MNIDCDVNWDDIPDWVLGLRNPDGYFDKYPPNFPEARGSQNGFKLDFDEAEWFLQQLNGAGINATMADYSRRFIRPCRNQDQSYADIGVVIILLRKRRPW